MPLTDPVPSSSFDVLERNIQDTDKFVNQETGTFTNRVGKVIKTIPVIEAEANAAVISLGWHQVGLFVDGFTYLLQNDIAKDTAGDWYRWNGTLPKVVNAGTLPSSDANFVKIDYKSHADLSDLNAAGGHDQIYDRSFQNVAEMISYSDHQIGLRYTTGRTSWEVVAAATGVSLTGGLYAKAITPVSPIDFGADKTGTVDSTLQFELARNAAQSSGESNLWPKGLFKLKDYNILTNQTIVSEGSVIQPLDNTSTAVLATNVDDWSLTGSVFFKGSRATLADKVNTGECGLKITGGKAFKLENAWFYRFKGVGYQRNDATFEYYGNKAQGVNITLVECLQGAKFGAQYDCYTNMSAIANELGIESIGGNLDWTGGDVTDNFDGFKITEGPNNAHGICSGVQFNHNKNLAIDIDKTREGFTFADCHIYADTEVLGKGGVRIKESRGIDFSGGTADCWIKMDESLGIEEDNYFRNMYAPGGYGPLKIFNSTTGQRSTSMRVYGVYGQGAINAADDLNVNDIAPVAYAVKRTSTFSIPVANGDYLYFNLVDTMGDVRGNLTSQANVIYEFPCVIGGYYEINSEIVLAGDTVTDTYIEILVDDVAVDFMYGQNIGLVGSKTALKFYFSKKVYATTKIAMKVFTGGTGLVHAISPFDSKLSIQILNR